MKVLYIDHYAGSTTLGMEFRPYYLAKEWRKYGIETTILAADFSHLRRENPVIEKDLVNKVIDDISFVLLKTTSYNNNGILRVLSMFQFLIKGLRYAKRISEEVKPDVVIASSTYPLDTYIGQKIKKLTGAKLFHEIHDLWPLSPMELGGYSKNHPFIMVMQRAENSAYRNSDGIVSILPNTKPYVESLGFSTPVYPIPNGLLSKDIDEIENNPVPNSEALKLIEELREKGKYIVGYAGGISVSNAMDDLIKAANILKDKDNISFLIIGNGILKDDLIKDKNSNDLKNVHFMGGIKKTEVIPTLSLMDALYIGSKKSKLYQYGVSANKIFDYLLAGKPIINAFDSLHSPLTYIGNTITAEAENPGSIADAIIKSTELSNEDREKISKESKEYVKKNHNYDYLAKKFKDLF